MRQQPILKTFYSFLLTFLFVFCAAMSAEARITRIIFSRRESPIFDGTSFGKVGQYEKLVGRAFGEVDPNDRRNSLITDIKLTPRNARGMVEYSMDIYILKPVDLSKGNHRMLFDINNRGDKRALVGLNDITARANDPTTAADAGNGFLMRQGYTIAWSGWDVTVAPGRNRLTITAPIARNPDGSTIVGPAVEEFVIQKGTLAKGTLTYAAADLDKSKAQLTVRNRYSDPPTPIRESGWEYRDDHTVQLLPSGTSFQAGSLYEFTYLAKDPIVAALGFAATRDFVSFLRNAATDGEETANPLAGAIQFIYSFGISQPSRFTHDFLYLGFNEDEQGKRVFDASYNYVGAASGGFYNYRFAQPGRTHRQHIARWYPEMQFPFANQVIFDPVTGKTDGRLRRCLATNTCPKIFEVNAANNYWAKAGSLLDTDTRGNDLPLDKVPNVRVYLFSSLVANAATESAGTAACQQPKNSVPDNPAHRALLTALDDWVSRGKQPPPSQVPRRSDGTLAPALPQESMGFPKIPGVEYTGVHHTGDLFDFGPSFDQGIITVLPPVIRDSAYPVFVPKTDRDGNDVAGIRLPEIAVPLATYTGWSLLTGRAAGDGCYGSGSGQQIKFAKTKTERLANGDPRLSIEERYQTHKGYVKKIIQAVRKLVNDRFLLEEDAERYIRTAETSNVLR